ncbi:MAG TPA: SUMF1/EgtB/PvdO family nonheme iron enzyme [Labilithrix sp.]
MRRLAIAGLVVCACGPSVRDVTDVGGAVVVIDTDMPVPKLVSRLRIDLYADDGTWYATHDVERAQPTDFPTSFGVYTPDDTQARVVLVRIRAYQEGKVRDYRGERFDPGPPANAAPFSIPAAPKPTDQPRLVDDAGNDVTPSSEPEPRLAIDRLVQVRLVPGTIGAARVVLRGACVGTMADVAGRASCVDTERTREPVSETPLGDDRSLGPSLVGQFDPPRPCTAPVRTPRPGLLEDEVCIPGGAFVLGSHDDVFTLVDDLPERVAIVAPFRMDRFEVTVARWRQAVADGFVSPDDTPVANEGALDTKVITFEDPSLCSWSKTPRERETYALSCVSQIAAHAFCKYLGADLPSEAQWEYAASVAGRARKSRFPWGGDDSVEPTCARAVWGRGELPLILQQCIASGFGPLAVDARAADGGDVTPTFGIVGFGGGVSEVLRDSWAPMNAACWARATLFEPTCDAPSTVTAGRGGSWHDNVVGTIVAVRRAADGISSVLGLRCVRSGEP